MSVQPILPTARLELRPLQRADSSRVQHLAGAPEIADTTLNIPHPYEDGLAEAWIDTLRPAWDRGEQATFAITNATDGLVGVVGLRIQPAHRRAELGYWIGVPYWGRGYASEAAGAVIRYGFDSLNLNRIYAHHLARNPTSGRVLLKSGMLREGLHPHHLVKAGRVEDVVSYGILR